jgi:hypothetical protein
MDNSTKKLLEECSVGCKMGIESMEQVQHHVTDAKIAATIEKSCSKHKELEEEISKILLRAGQPEKEPGVIVSTFSWMTTGVKMMTGEDENKQAVKIIMNGCNMGTQSITCTNAKMRRPKVFPLQRSLLEWKRICGMICRNICRNICKMKCCQLWNKFVTDGIFIYKLFNFFQNNL